MAQPINPTQNPMLGAVQNPQNSPINIQQAVKTPLPEGLISRVVRGVKYVVSGASPEGWFTPMQPLPPFAPDQGVEGRRFDYQVGYNLVQQPKLQEGLSFSQLRAMADSLDLLRLAIETRKDLMCKLEWEIKPLNPDQEKDGRCEEIMEFFRFPDQENSWNVWFRMVLEDLFVIDAPCIYPRMNYGGKLFALEPLDGATIKRVIDGGGRTPQPPEVAYQQVLKGVPAVDYSRDELIYKPRNLRTNRVYGYSPVEQIIISINIALRRQMSQLQFYTEGSTPDLILSVPPEWNPDQVKQFYDWWQSMLSGNTGNRRKTMFVPGGVNTINTKEGMLKDAYDEWLAKIICYAFSLSPQQFVGNMNRASGETAVEMAKEEGLFPIMQWARELMNYIIWKYWGYKDLGFTWVDTKDPDPLLQAQINEIYVRNGVKTPNEIREELGLEALPEYEEEVPEELTNRKPIGDNPEADEQAAAEEQAIAIAEKDGAYIGDVVKGRRGRLKKAWRVLPPLNRQRRVVTQTRAKVRRVIKARLDEVRNSVIAQIAAKRGEIGKADGDDDERRRIEALIASLTIEWGDLAVFMGDELQRIAADAVKEAAAQISFTDRDATKLARTRAEAWAKERGAELVGMTWRDGTLIENPNAEWSISGSTRDLIRADVVNALEQGSTMDELADRLSQNYAFSEDRAKMIARTEVAYADVHGNVEAYKEAKAQGVEVLKKWITAGDDLVSEDCRLNGESDPIPLDALFPSGVGEPPDHPNCRCDVSPVVLDLGESED